MPKIESWFGDVLEQNGSISSNRFKQSGCSVFEIIYNLRENAQNSILRSNAKFPLNKFNPYLPPLKNQVGFWEEHRKVKSFYLEKAK